jgi:hypothetical protein
MAIVSRREAALQAEASSSEGPHVVECPYCGARPGYACRKEGTCDIISYPHKEAVIHGKSQETTPPPATASSSRSESSPPSPTTEALGSTR